MKKIVLFLILFMVLSSCNNERLDVIETRSELISTRNSTSFYNDYSDDQSYTLEEFIELNHDEYGEEFINDHLNSIVDNIALISQDEINDVYATKIKIKFRFRWNGCNPLGACLIITFGNASADPDLTECIVGVRNGKLIVIPQGAKNGMLSDGYIFVDPIEIGDDEADLLGLPHGTMINPGIYKSKTPTNEFPYGYHIFDLSN